MGIKKYISVEEFCDKRGWTAYFDGGLPYSNNRYAIRVEKKYELMKAYFHIGFEGKDRETCEKNLLEWANNGN